MRVGQNTFVRVRNDAGKESSLPVSFIVTLLDMGRTLYNSRGLPLTVRDMGERNAVEIQVTGPIPRSVRKEEVHLVLDPDEMIQGVRARDIRAGGKGYAGDTLQSTEGDAKVKRVRGHSQKSKFRDRIYEVNATGDVHGILIG